ncbi:MAG: hypothetical protein DRO88_13565, partial [Promethearchaeia archaeon]
SEAPFTIENSYLASPFLLIPVESFEQILTLEKPDYCIGLYTHFENGNSLQEPDLLLDLKLQSLESIGNINGTTQSRVKLIDFKYESALSLTNVVAYPEGTTPISPWPFQMYSGFEKPTVHHSLFLPSFDQIMTFEPPSITAGETTHLSASSFSHVGEIKSNVNISLSVQAFTENSWLDLLAIKTMPAGDQYLVAPSFNQNSSLSIPNFSEGVFLAALSSNMEITIGNIYLGISVEALPFEYTQELFSELAFTISMPPLAQNSSILSSLDLLISLHTFELNNSFMPNISVYDGDFIVFPTLTQQSGLSIGISYVLSMPPLELTNFLVVPGIDRFVSMSPLIINSTLVIDDIVIFTYDLADIFYYFTLTGDGITHDDVEIPISSFQCNMRNDAPTYLQVTIPGLDYVDEIIDRPNGRMIVSLGYKLNGEIVRKKEIVSADLEEPSFYRGPESQSIVLSGHKTESYTPKEITLDGEIYQSITSGKNRYRIAKPNIDLKPGDTVTIDGTTFTADLISYYFRATKNGINQIMEIAEG